MSKSEEGVANVAKTYELSYLFSPLVSAEEVVALVASELKAAVLTAGAVVERETEPKMTKLSFPIGRSVEHKRTVYKEAYFGTLVFKAETSELAQIEEQVKFLPNVIRFSIIISPKNFFQVTAFKKPLSARRVIASKPIKTVAPEGNLTNEQIDKEIEGLLAPAA